MENKRQRQQALQREIIKKINGEPLMEITDEDLKLMDEINNNIQTKTRWSDTERWIAAVIATLGTFGFIYWLYTIGYLIHFGIYTLLTWLVVMIVFLVKHLIDNLIDGR